MNISDWDQLIAPVLHRIEANAKTARRHIQYAKSEVAHLVARPNWVSLAEDDLLCAKAELETALTLINQAIELYRNIPVEEQK